MRDRAWYVVRDPIRLPFPNMALLVSPDVGEDSTEKYVIEERARLRHLMFAQSFQFF